MYPIFTVTAGNVARGAEVEALRLSSGAEIAAILIGEEGRGRQRGVMAVCGCQPGETVAAGELGETRSGASKIVRVGAAPDVADHALIVLRSPIGYRGGNSHHGDRLDFSPGGQEAGFKPFPGRILARGRIAQGDAGRMGSGEQMIALIPAGVVFRLGLSGRCYGTPMSYYYAFDGSALHVATWDERELLADGPLALS